MPVRGAARHGRCAAVEWWASYREGGADVSLIGITVLRFGDDGLVTQHTDYWAEASGRTRVPFPGWGE